MARKSASAKVVEVLGWGGRSASYRWLWEHYDEIVATKLGRYRWKNAAAELVRLGIVKVAPTPDALRKAFARVEADKMKVPATTAGRPVASVSEPKRNFAVSPVRSLPEPLEDDDEFKPVGDKR